MYDAGKLAPADADFVIAVDDAAGMRRGMVGQGLSAILAAALDLDRTGESWKKFAKQLDLSQEEAFDRLLGKRFALVQRWSIKGDSSWAIRSVVDRTTDEFLRARLKPAPRKMEKGTVVLSIEDGAFWLALRATGENTAIILGPGTAPGLFDEMLTASGAGQPDNEHAVTLADEPYFKDIRALDGQATGFFFLRLTGLPDGGEHPRDSGWLACALRPHDDTLHIGFMARLEAADAPPTERMRWSRRAFDELSRDSYFTVMSWATSFDAAQGPLRALKDLVPALPREIVGEAGRIGGAGGLAGPRRALVVRQSAGMLPSPVYAVETVNATKLTAVADRQVGAGLAWVDRMFAGAATDSKPTVETGGAKIAEPNDFAGMFPDAVRTADVADHLPPVLAGLVPRGTVLAWTCRRGGSIVEGEQSGWGVIGIGVKNVEAVTAALTREHRAGVGKERKEDAGLPWLSLGVARPSAFVEAIEKQGVPIPPALVQTVEALHGVEEISWQALPGGERGVLGFGEVRFVDVKKK
ncbi:MAG TPA: hypothetical protein VG797_10130 [Phycisphaerales bacterium]|nr:hypothetical protein [Phycisphaerales bacterium]